MKFKKLAIPEPSEGIDYSDEVSLVIPDQSLSLEEILQRFTRGEELPVGFEGVFDEETEDDLEKLGRADLVDKYEYSQKMQEIQKEFEAQEKAREKAEREAEEKRQQAELDKKIRIAAKKLAKSNLAQSA